MKPWPHSSMVKVMKAAASESERTIRTRSDPNISACARHATRRLIYSLIGTMTLPPYAVVSTGCLA